MFALFAEKITNRLLITKVIEKDDREIYQFGIEQFLISILHVISVFVIGCVFHQLGKLVLFTMAFMWLRSYAGGYHASTSKRCYILTISIMIIVLSVMQYFEKNIVICIGCFCGALCIIFLFSPVEAKTKKLDRVEEKVYRKKVYAICGVEAVCAVFLLLIGLKDWAVIIMMAHIVIAISLIFGKCI